MFEVTIRHFVNHFAIQAVKRVGDDVFYRLY